MRFLLIDPDTEYRRVLRYHINAAWPDARIDECAPANGALDDSLGNDGIEPASYDLILLGYPADPAAGERWLHELVERPRHPPVIVFAAQGDEFLAVDAMRAGASSYFPKHRVRHARLTDTIAEVANVVRESAAARTGDSGLVRKLRQPYELVRELHASNIATVWLARDPEDGSEVALKVIHYVPDAGGDSLFDRFLQEYAIVAALEHPNIVRIVDLGVADDQAFLVMEYLSNGSLAERLSQPLEPGAAIACTRQIAAALVGIHGAGVLHRDLKPANIMFRDDDTLALIDFGLAKNTALDAALTGAGHIFGTPYYMSPEQGHADETDQRSDLYSLGCVVHEMLTGRRPFVAASAMGVIYKHANAPRPQLPAGLQRYQRLLDGLLAVAPDERFGSATELLTALDALG